MHGHSSVGDSWQKMGWITHQVYHTQGELMFPKFCISYRFTFMFVCVQLYRKCACITDRVSAGHIQPVFLVKIVSVINIYLHMYTHLYPHAYVHVYNHVCVCVYVCVWGCHVNCVISCESQPRMLEKLLCILFI